MKEVWYIETGRFNTLPRIIMKAKIILLIGLSLFLRANSQTVTISSSTFGTLCPITVSYAGASGVNGSWIGLYRADGGDGDYMTYQYINEILEGTLEFPGREETGLFNFRLFRGGGYDKIGTSSTFMIRQGMLLDASFKDGGVFRRDFLASALDDWAVAVRITADDEIVVAGSAKTGIIDAGGYEQNDFTVTRFTSEGQLDPTFGDGGFAHASFTTISAKEARAMVVQTDGKIIVGGIGQTFGENARVLAVMMVRFNKNGTIDESFGEKGVLIDNFKWPTEGATFAWDDLRCMELDPEGRILVGGGSLLDRPYSPGRPFMGRYTKEGQPDMTFGSLGMITPSDSIGFRGYVESIIPPAPGGDGSIYAGCTAAAQFGMNNFLVYKLKGDGSFEPGFGHNGILVEKRPGYHNNQYIKSIQMSPAGELVMMGGSDVYATWLAGKNPIDGSDVNTFGDQGIGYLDPTYGNDIAGGMVITATNRLVIGLSTLNGRWSVARFEPNGKLRTDFGVSFYPIMENGTPVESFLSGFGMQKNGSYVLIGGSKFPGAANWDHMILRFTDNPEGLSGIEENRQIFGQLSQNFPNPFSQSTTISWTQANDSHISITVYDILGNQVAELVNGTKSAGKHQITFNRDGCDNPLPAGNYFYQIRMQPTGPGINPLMETRKMTIMPGAR
jgi:uncharacterized delta-60 repeat protein